MKLCAVEGCENKLHRDNQTGLCKPHRHQSPIAKDQAKLKAAQWKRDNRDRINARRRTRWAEDDAHRERELERGRKWKVENPDKIKDYTTKNYEENAEELREKSRAWAKNNPEKARARNQIRRTQKKNAFIESVDLIAVWRRDAGLCFICGYPADEDNWWLEHIVPLSRGGMHSYDNVAVSHPPCNMRKGDKLMEELDLENW